MFDETGELAALERRSLEMLRSIALRLGERAGALEAIRALWSPMSGAAWRYWRERLETLESDLAAEVFAKIVDGERSMPEDVVESLVRLAREARDEDRRDLACFHYVALARAKRIAAIESDAMVWFGDQMIGDRKASWAEELARDWLARPRSDSRAVVDFLRDADKAVGHIVRGQLSDSDRDRRLQRRLERDLAMIAEIPEREEAWVKAVLTGRKDKLDE